MIHRLLTRHWLRRYRKQKVIPSVRAVFLGDLVSTDIILDGSFVPYELALLEREVFPYLPENGTCLDIGANIGNHSSFFAGHFDRVVAFEPNPVVHHLLCANTFGLNVDVVHLGLSDKAATLSFSQNFQNMGASRVTRQNDPKADMEIHVARLDDLEIANGLTNVTFVKIDVEGHEAEALRGAQDVLSAHKPVIALEAHFKSNPEQSKAVLSILDELGYSHFYQMRPQSAFVRKLLARGHTLRRGIWNVVLPDRMRKAVHLELCDNPQENDHALLIVATKPIPNARVQSD